MGKDERTNGAEREPGEQDEAEDEDEDRVPVAELERFGRCLGGRRADPEGARGRFEAVGVLVAPERKNRGPDEPERHQPQEDPERDAARDQAASQLALVLQHLANQAPAGQLLGLCAKCRQPVGQRRRSRPLLGLHRGERNHSRLL